ncbi:LysE family translocator [Psychromonas arctica]|uniref:LysE family translocator n=1 Tax=Psychromonas arctica TaxID=168275 RepID=A0ABU9HEM9_9GAMM
MELSTWLVYVSVISVLIFSPGPSALLCISDGVKFGNKKTIPTIIGGAIAALMLMTVSAVGLGAILTASETLFFVLKIFGAGYLLYLGWSAWREGALNSIPEIKPTESLVEVQRHHQLSHYSAYSLFRKGFMVGISNPKDLLFFIALFPSFMNADLPQVEQYAVLACTWFFIDCSSMFMYAGLGSKISPLLTKPNTMMLVNRTVGSVFVILGSALAISAGMSRKG